MQVIVKSPVRQISSKSRNNNSEKNTSLFIGGHLPSAVYQQSDNKQLNFHPSSIIPSMKTLEKSKEEQLSQNDLFINDDFEVSDENIEDLLNQPVLITLSKVKEFQKTLNPNNFKRLLEKQIKQISLILYISENKKIPTTPEGSLLNNDVITISQSLIDKNELNELKSNFIELAVPASDDAIAEIEERKPSTLDTPLSTPSIAAPIVLIEPTTHMEHDKHKDIKLVSDKVIEKMNKIKWNFYYDKDNAKAKVKIYSLAEIENLITETIKKGAYGHFQLQKILNSINVSVSQNENELIRMNNAEEINYKIECNLKKSNLIGINKQSIDNKKSTNSKLSNKENKFIEIEEQINKTNAIIEKKDLALKSMLNVNCNIQKTNELKERIYEQIYKIGRESGFPKFDAHGMDRYTAQITIYHAATRLQQAIGENGYGVIVTGNGNNTSLMNSKATGESFANTVAKTILDSLFTKEQFNDMKYTVGGIKMGRDGIAYIDATNTGSLVIKKGEPEEPLEVRTYNINREFVPSDKTIWYPK